MADVNEVVVIPEAQIETVNNSYDDAQGTAAFVATVGASVGAGIVGTLIFQKLRKAWHEAKLRRHERRKAEEAAIEAELASRKEQEQTSDQNESESDE